MACRRPHSIEFSSCCDGSYLLIVRLERQRRGGELNGRNGGELGGGGGGRVLCSITCRTHEGKLLWQLIMLVNFASAETYAVAFNQM